MKKMLKYAVLATTFIAGSLGVQARYWEPAENPITPEDVQPGKNYVLQSALTYSVGSKAFLNGTGFSTMVYPPQTAVYQFESANEATSDGTAIFYLKRQSGEYLAAPSNGSFYTMAIERAWKITVKAPTYNDPNFTYAQEGVDAQGNPTTNNLTGIAAYRAAYRAQQLPDLDWSTFTFQNVDGAVVLVSATPGTPVEGLAEYNALATHTANNQDQGLAAKGIDYNRNCWVIFEAKALEPIASLEAEMNQITTGTIEEKITNYVIGEGAGQYSKDKKDLLVSLWNQGKALVEAGQGSTPEDIDKLSNDIVAAYNDFINSGKPLVAGYYIITNWRSERETGYDGGALYDGSALNPASMKLCWTYNGQGGATYTAGQALDYPAAKFVWEVTPDPANEGLFFFKNLETGNYIGTTPTMETVVPMTTTPDASYNIVANPEQPGFFSFYNPKLFHTAASDFGGLHTSSWRGEIVPWDWRTGGSSWHVREISQEELAALRALMEQPKRNAALTRIYNAAQTAIVNGKAYMAVDDSGNKIADATSGKVYAADGLVTDASNLACPMTETTEGTDLAALLDATHGTYHHSAWSASWGGPHYLQMTLATPEKDVLFKWVKRNGNNTNGAPYDIVVWGTNNEADLAIDKVTTTNDAGEQVVTVDGWKQTWKQLGTGRFNYIYDVTWSDGSNKTKAAGTARVAFDEPYKYLRMEIVTRQTDGDKPNGNKYFNGAEFRVYKAAYDKANSLIEAVPANVQQKLNEAMTAAKVQIDGQNATDEMIATLQAAYDEFMQNYPDPTRITSAIAEARAVLAAAQEGPELGYYQEGSRAAAESVLQSVQTQLDNIVAERQPTVAEVDNLLSQLNAGMNTFADALRVPESGFYFIKSNSSNETMFARSIYAGTSSRDSYLKMEGRVNKEGTWANDEDIKSKLGAYWEVTKVDGGYTYKNLYTGLYIAPNTKDKSRRMVTQSETPYVFAIRFAKEPGCFNLMAKAEDVLEGTYLYLNTQPGDASLVFWNAANGRDNSAFRFELANPAEILKDGHLHKLQKQNRPQIVTLPVAVTVAESDNFYTVIGQDANKNIQLKKVSGELVAGQAYVLKPEESNTETNIILTLKAQNIGELVQTHTEAEPVNGLVPTFENIKIAAQSGIFSTDHSQVLLSEENESVTANTGYFTKLPVTEETGDAFIPANGIITGINNFVVLSKADSNGVYTISGIRVKNANHLPAGLYIVNGQKVLVK